MVGESPQLETGSATIGQVIDSKLISEIPLGDGTAYGLTRLIPGASFERSYALQRPMDNDNLRGMTITGTINSEFTIDGSSNVVSQARAGIQPPSDAIEEFKVETAAYDAQIGHTGAGAVNLALKTGTNQFHGSASYYNRDDSRSANLFASNRNGSGKTPRNYNRFSGAHRRPDLQEQDVLHVLVREAAGRHDRVVHELGADGEDADGRLLRAAVERRADLRSAHRAPRERRRRPRSVSRQHHPGRQNQPGRAQRARILSRRRIRPPAADFSQNFFVEQPWTYAYNFQMMRIDHEWTRQPAHLRALHPELQARRAIQLRRRDEGRRDHARRDRSLQLQLCRRPHGGAVADDRARHEGKLAALQRRSVPALHDRSGEPRVFRVDGRALR